MSVIFQQTFRRPRTPLLNLHHNPHLALRQWPCLLIHWEDRGCQKETATQRQGWRLRTACPPLMSLCTGPFLWQPNYADIFRGLKETCSLDLTSPTSLLPFIAKPLPAWKPLIPIPKHDSSLSLTKTAPNKVTHPVAHHTAQRLTLKSPLRPHLTRSVSNIRHS